MRASASSSATRALGPLVEAGVLDGLRDLRGDRRQQADLVVVVLAGPHRAHVHRAQQALAAVDHRHREQRLEALLGQVRERLEARVEVRVGGDRDGLAHGRGVARQALARLHPRRRRGGRQGRAVDGHEHELAGGVVVHVDEARVGLQRPRHGVRDGARDLDQVERARDQRDGLREQAQVSGGAFHRRSVPAPRTVPAAGSGPIPGPTVRRLAAGPAAGARYARGPVVRWRTCCSRRPHGSAPAAVRRRPT